MAKPFQSLRDRVEVRDLLAAARGRWREILRDAGLPDDALTDGRGRPCPKCGGRDRFAIMSDFPDRGSLSCRHCFNKGTDPRPGDGLASLRWWLGATPAEAARWLAGWLGIGPGDAMAIRRPIERRLSVPDPGAEVDHRLAEIADRWFRSIDDQTCHRFATSLGVSHDSLTLLRMGWAADYRATSWPMVDANARVIGIRLRCPETARKWAVVGSRAGLFVPAGLAEVRRLFVCEGPTDTAALLSIGLDAVGVPSAGGVPDLLARLIRRLMPADVVIVADGDGPGRVGADRLAAAVIPVRPVRVMSPPDGVKDSRAWVGLGATRHTIEDAAEAASLRSLRIGRATR
jgi:phage/plasmid primase-like uncharacterized protein